MLPIRMSKMRMRMRSKLHIRRESPSTPTLLSRWKIGSFRTSMQEALQVKRITTRMKNSLFTLCTREQFTAGHSSQSTQGLMRLIMSAPVHPVTYYPCQLQEISYSSKESMIKMGSCPNKMFVSCRPISPCTKSLKKYQGIQIPGTRFKRYPLTTSRTRFFY